MRTDAMLGGSNVEISNRLTPVRRPGLSTYNSQQFTSVDYFYEFRLFSTTSEQIKVMTDTSAALYDGTGPSTQALVYTKTGAEIGQQTFMQYVANILYFGTGVNQKKWLQTLTTWQATTAYSLANMSTFIIDPNGNVQQAIAASYSGATISSAQIASDLLTLTVNSTTAIGSNGTTATVVLWDLTTATFLNGATLTITVTGPTTVTASFTHANYGPTSDTGVIGIQSGGTATSGGSQPSWNASSSAPNNTTVDGTVVWANRGSQIENWGIVGPTVAPTVNPGASNSGWQPNAFYSDDGAAIVDSNGNLQKVTTNGTSGATQPSWATNVGAVTTDGTVVWTMTQTAASMVWAAHTEYGPTPITNFSITSNVVTFTAANNLSIGQTVVASGLSVGTYLNGVYLQVQSGTSGTQVVASSTTFTHANVGSTADSGTLTPGAFIIAAAGGSNCLFEVNVTTPSVPTLSGTINVSYWNSTANGAVDVKHTPRSPDGTFTSPSLSWFAATGQTVQMRILNGAGEVTGQTNTGKAGGWEAAIMGSVNIPVAGNYSFTFLHDDGGFMGFGAGPATPSVVFGTNGGDLFGNTVTVVNGYPIACDTNLSGQTTDSCTINFPIAGVYPFEIDWTNWKDAAAMVLTCSGNEICPQPSESATTQPLWPSFSTNFAPNYATVSEAQGQYVWSNLGPTTDFSWHAKILFPSITTIIDPNNNSESAFRTGITGTKIPTFNQALYGLTADNPNLIWINLGPAPAPPVGTLSTFNGGWSYAISLVNTVNNTVSNASPVTTATGNFVGSSGVTVSGGLPASIDPQVDYVAIFRTKDGGANWYLIDGPGNTVYTTTLAQYQANGYFDTTADANLNILLQAPLEEENSPPPTGLINLTYHLNRVFGSVGNTVYWSTGPDIPIGNGAEGFDPDNFATFPSFVRRIVPTSIGALIFTVSDIFLIGGQGTTNSPLFPQPYASGIGLLSYNALDVNGTLIYLFTSDSQVISLDPSSGIGQVGFPIGDQFEKSNWNPSNVYVTWHVSGSQDQALYVSDGATGWFRLTPTASPETGLTWSPFASITLGLKAVQSIETAPGVHRLLVGPSGTGPILRRDLTVNTDGGLPYLANFTIGSLVLAQPGQIAEIGFITTDCAAIGSKPTLGVLLDEIGGTFDPLPNSVADPPELPPSGTTYNQRFYLSQTQDPAICRHMQVEVNWPAENFANELYSMTIFGSYASEA